MAACLADAVASGRLARSRRWLETLVEARVRDLETSSGQPESLNELERYCVDTHGALALLALDCLQPDPVTKLNKFKHPPRR